LQKFKDESDSELVGYQLAERMGLPVQPWLAAEVETLENTGIEKSNILMLIQKWPLLEFNSMLLYPARTHASLVGDALALATLTTEWPCWMMDQSKTQIRLCDLEFFGPPIFFSHPLSVNTYVAAICSNVDKCYETACERQIRAEFLAGVERLIGSSNTADFSGHSREKELNTAVASFLNPALQFLSDWVSAKTETVQRSLK
jgi:hypothetical protein